jgi:hypothetical protein
MRSLQDLFLFDLAGKEAAIASLDLEGARDLTGAVLSLDELDPDSKAATERNCPACGESVAGGMNFCPVCGMEMGEAGVVSAPASKPVTPPGLPREKSSGVVKPELKPEPVPARAEAAQGHPKFCMACGSPLKPQDKFCKSCGKKV